MALTAKKVYAILKRQISDMEAKLNSPVRYRGTVTTADLLPLNPDIGDMYNIESKSVYGEAGMNVAWNGVVWDTMGAPIDMSLYIKSSELADWVKQQNKPTYTADEVGALPDTTVIPSKTSELQNDSGFLTKIPDNYISGTDKTLSASGKAADAKATGDKITELSADISNKLNKNQGSENSGKIAGINEYGDIVPIFPVGVEYNSETNYLEFGSDQKMELNQGIGLDSTLTKTGSAADAGATGKEINSLKEDKVNKNGYGEISEKNTTFFKSSLNVFDKTFTHAGYYGSNGWWFENTTWKTIIVRVEPNKKYTTHEGMWNNIVYFKNGLETFGVFKNAAKSELVISGIQTSDNAWKDGTYTFTTPDNCYYVAMSCLTSRNLIDHLMVVKGGEYPSEYIEHRYLLVAERENDFLNESRVSKLEEDNKFVLYKNPYTDYFTEPYRPQYHLSGESGWMNDINGFIEYNGLYHVYYQYQEGSVGRGNIGWGHAISNDLVKWKHKAPALVASYPLKQIWSGCCVVDEKDLVGYGTNTILAYYTLYDNQNGSQEVHMAYSYDGDKFIDIPNAILPTDENLRDPNVIYDSTYSRWLMAVASSDNVKIYQSDDMSTWNYLDTINIKCECPLLVEDKSIMYLFWSSYSDGEVFAKLSITETNITVGAGRLVDSHKAGFTGSYGSNVLRSNGKNYIASWMQAPDRSDFINLFGHSGSMSLVREISFNKNGNLIQIPITGGLRKDGFYSGQKIYLPENQTRKIHIIIKHSEKLTDSSSVVLKIMGGVKIVYMLKSGDVNINRSSVSYYGDKQYYSDYTLLTKPIVLDNQLEYTLDIFIDKCNLEMFFNDGIVVSETVYSDGKFDAFLECTEDVTLEVEDYDIPYTLDNVTVLNTNVNLLSDYCFNKEMKNTVCGRTISAGGYYSFIPTNANFSLSFDVKQLGENVLDIMVGVDDKNCIRASLSTKDISNEFHVHKHVDGKKTWLGNGKIEIPHTNGELKDYITHKFKMVVSKSAISYYFDGTLIHSIEDAIDTSHVIIKSSNVQSCTIQNLYCY